MTNKLLALRVLTTAITVLLGASVWAIHGPAWANFGVGCAAGLSFATLLLAWQGDFGE